LEIVLVSKPLGLGTSSWPLWPCLQNGTRRLPGWYGVAASFDDVQLTATNRVPSRFLHP